MALTFVDDTNGSVGTSSVTPNAPSFEVLEGDHVLILLALKRAGEATYTLPDGWTQIDSTTVGTGSSGAGQGPVDLYVLHHQVGPSGLTVPTIELGGTSSGRVASAGIVVYRGDLGVDSRIALYSSSGSDTSNGSSFNVTSGAAIPFEPGDEVLVFSVVTANIDEQANPVLDLPNGLSTSSQRNPYNNGTGSGDDMRVSVYATRINSGSARGTASLTATLMDGGSPVSSTGGALFMRLREVRTQRFYFTNVAPEFAPSTTNHFGDWDDISEATPARLLGVVPAGTSTFSEATEESSSNNYRAMLRQFVSAPAAAAGTLGGRWKMAAGFRESSGNANLVPYITVWVTQGDSSDYRDGDYAVFIAGADDDEFPTSAGGVEVAEPDGAPVQVEIHYEAGDRLVVEVGYRALNTSTTDYTGRMYFGGTGVADMSQGENDMSMPGWIDLQVTPGAEFADPFDTQRFYITSAPAPTQVGFRLAFWDQETEEPPLLLGTAPAGSSQELQNTEEAEDPAWVMMLGQWCSPPATADGTLVALDWRATIATYQSSTSADFLHVIGAWIMGADGSFREQLAAGIFVGELPTGAPEGEQMTLAVGRGADLLPQDIFEGERIVVEIGVYAQNDEDNPYTATVLAGGTGPDLQLNDSGEDAERPGWIDIQVSPGLEFVEPEDTSTPPATAFDLTNWKITIPVDGPDAGSTADEIEQPELDSYASEYFYLDAEDRMVFRAPVDGATTSGSGATRSELREMENGGTEEAAWSIFDPQPRSLTVSGYYDPTSIEGGSQPRQEMIVGQIHSELGNPALYIAAEYHVSTPRLRLFKYNGSSTPGVDNLVEGISPSTLVTYRIEYDPGADPANGTGRINVYGAIGDVDDLPSSPQFSFAPADFFDQTEGYYFKAGAYNKTEVDSGSSGAAVTRVTYLELVQPQAAEIEGEAAASLGGITAQADGEVTDHWFGTATASLGQLTAQADGEVSSITVVVGSAAAGEGPDPAEYPSEDNYPSEDTYPGEGLPRGLGGLVATATGTTTVEVEGAGAASLGQLTATAAGARTVLGAAAALLGDLSAAADAARTVLGAATAPLGAVTGAAAGIAFTPIEGTASASLGPLVATATGTREVTSTGSATLGGLAATAVGLRSTTGAAAAELGGLAATAGGVQVEQGTASAPLGGVTATATGERTVAGLATAASAVFASASGVRVTAGTASAQLGFTAAAGSARVVPATADAELGQLTATAEGVVTNVSAGAAAANLGALTATANGIRQVVADASAASALVASSGGIRSTTGSAAANLGGLVAAAGGAQLEQGTGVASLGDLSATANGEREVIATAAAQLDATATAAGVRTTFATAAAVSALTAHAGASSSAVGSGAAQLGGLAAAATGRREIAADASAALGQVSATASGTRSTAATAAANLGDLAATATGVRTGSGSGTATADLGQLAATATGTRDTFATAAAASALVASAGGTRSTSGTGVADLGDLTATAGGEPSLEGTASAELGGLTATANGQVSTPAGAAANLGGLTASATGEREVVAVVTAPIGLAATAAGTRAASGTGSAPLGALVALAVGDGVSLIVADEAVAALGQLVAHADGVRREQYPEPFAGPPVVHVGLRAGEPTQYSGGVYAGVAFDPDS